MYTYSVVCVHMPLACVHHYVLYCMYIYSMVCVHMPLACVLHYVLYCMCIYYVVCVHMPLACVHHYVLYCMCCTVCTYTLWCVYTWPWLVPVYIYICLRGLLSSTNRTFSYPNTVAAGRKMDQNKLIGGSCALCSVYLELCHCALCSVYLELGHCALYSVYTSSVMSLCTVLCILSRLMSLCTVFCILSRFM